MVEGDGAVEPGGRAEAVAALNHRRDHEELVQVEEHPETVRKYMKGYFEREVEMHPG